MSNHILTFHLPDLLIDFPWPRSLSEHYHEAKAESSTWTESFHPFNEDGLKGFNLCDFSMYFLPLVELHLTCSPGRSPRLIGIFS